MDVCLSTSRSKQMSEGRPCSVGDNTARPLTPCASVPRPSSASACSEMANRLALRRAQRLDFPAALGLPGRDLEHVRGAVTSNGVSLPSCRKRL
jgi:hypothetical protein